MSIATIGIVIAAIFITRGFNILIGVFFWECTEREMSEGAEGFWPFYILWMLPVTGDFMFVWNLLSFTFYPLSWLARKSLVVKKETDEKKKREIRIAEKVKTLAQMKEELQEKLADKELKEVEAQLRGFKA